MTPLAATDIDAPAIASRVENDGFCVVSGVLDAAATGDALARLWAAAAESERRGVSTRVEGLDPTSSNVRVWNLIDLDPLFGDLIAHPAADAIVTAVLGDRYIVSNFTANIARPGSGSMRVHSDQSLVMPGPWLSVHTMNIIWCLTDVCADNGATLYVPGSHRWTCSADIPADPMAAMQPFEARAGSIIVMDGRVWHTSGANVTTDQDRALLFGFYSQPFVRPQWNHNVGLSSSRQAALDDSMRYRLGLDVWQNVGNT